MASTYRINRVRGLLTRELGEIIMQLKDPRVRGVTVVDTEVSKDLHYVKIFISILGTEEERQTAIAALENALGFIRRQVAKRVELRVVPELRIVYDNTIERAASLTAMIDRLVKEESV